MSDQTLLREVGGRVDPPVLYKDKQFGPISVVSKGKICPGYLGQVVTRDRYGFVGFREHSSHYHRKKDAYVLSTRVVNALRREGVQLMLIAEEDTGTVYEWHISHFAHEMPKSGKSDREANEPQLYAPVDDAWGVFENQTEDVLIGARETN